MKIHFFGATGQVTGSNYLVETERYRFLVDCGQYQGLGDVERQNYDDLPFEPSSIDFVILTHAHIDHCGRLPLLTMKGFTGKIYCTYPTSDLTGMMLKDSGKIHEEELEWENRKRMRAGLDPVQALFTVEDAENCIPYLYPVDYERTVEVNNDISFRFIDAGHLLGSASISLTIKDKGHYKKVAFSGDLGTGHNPLLPAPSFIEEADYVVMESTYGNRTHIDMDHRGPRLAKIILDTLTAGGTVIIPAFAVGRTQEALFILKKYYEDMGNLEAFYKIPIYIDSPLAINATKFYQKHHKHLQKHISELYAAGNNPLDESNIHYVNAHGESIALNQSPEPKVIISASGMCEAGRIKHHLKHYLWKKESAIVFIGYQGDGTLGRALKEGLKMVKMFNEDIIVNSSIHSLDGFSGHADQEMLRRWFAHIKGVKKVFITHGDPPAATALAASIRERFGVEVVVPEKDTAQEI